MLHVLVALGAVVVLYALALGIRLLRGAHALRAAPELALGLFFVLVSALGYIPRIVGAELALLSPDYAVPLYRLAIFGLTLSAAPITWFTWQVFRPDSRGAGIYTCAVAAVSVVLAVASYRASSGVAGDAPLLGPRIALNAASVGWACFESVKHWLRARKRAAIGLADPAVVNRFLLWGIGTGLMITMVAVRWLSRTLIGAAVPGELSTARIVVSLVQTGIGLGVVAAMWLTFYPPAAYQRWVQPEGASPDANPTRSVTQD